jgi:hypothetical protein
MMQQIHQIIKNNAINPEKSPYLTALVADVASSSSHMLQAQLHARRPTLLIVPPHLIVQ